MSEVWRPSATVAAVIERDGKFLLVEEVADGRRVLNQPAGHLDPGESLVEACARETLEETAHRFTPTALVGIYRWVYDKAGVTFLRFAFAGRGPLQEEVVAVDLARNQAAQIFPDPLAPLVELAHPDPQRRSP